MASTMWTTSASNYKQLVAIGLKQYLSNSTSFSHLQTSVPGVLSEFVIFYLALLELLKTIVGDLQDPPVVDHAVARLQAAVGLDL